MVDALKSTAKLVDVARHAGVSPATVSRVLNNTAPVRASVRARVNNSLRALGYKAAPARASASFKGAIVLLIPDILNPFFTEIVRGVQDEASVDKNMLFLFDAAEDPRKEEQFLRMLTTQSIAGMILCGSRMSSQEIASACSYQSAPMVVLNRTVRHPNASCILVELENATYRATRHLIDLKHTQIAYLGGPTTSEPSQVRRRGIDAALAESGLSLKPELFIASYPNVDGGFQAMSAVLARPLEERPTAVIAYNDVMALGILHAIRAHHLRVPEDISVIGMDDIEMASHTNPPLTTIQQPKYRMGRLAMQILYRMMQGHPPPGEGYALLESPLIVRESTAIARPNGSGRAQGLGQ
jgi:DNA-binding LacI/PurR family transcriptional regulator